MPYFQNPMIRPRPVRAQPKRRRATKVPNRRKAPQPKKQPRKNKLHQKAIPMGRGGFYSKFYYGKRKLPLPYRVLKNLAKNYQSLNGSARVTSVVGQQNVATQLAMYTTTDLTTMATNVSANATQKVIHLSVSAEVMITNQDVGNCVLTLYDIIARRDLTTTAVNNPGQAWASSYSDEGGSNTDYQIIGATPFSSDLFTQFFKVLKITHVFLGQGESHSHKVYFSPNRQIDKEYINNEAQGIKGLTCFTSLVAYGAPYNDATTKTSVSTGQVTLDVVYRKQYKYSFIADSTTTWFKTNNLTTFAVGESIMDPGTGAAVASDVAA
nr:MAG: capsid protein [Cressdnaviricota sp.]